jgi:CheY-like chemotaxis protein
MGTRRGERLSVLSATLPIMPTATTTTLAICADLMFASRIGAEARAVDAPIRFARNDEKLTEILDQSESIPLALVDMAIESIDPAIAIAQLKRAHPESRVIAFFSHVNEDQKRAAQSAGAETMPRSRFVQELPGLLRGFAGDPAI